MTLRPIPTIDLGRTKPHITGALGNFVRVQLTSLVIDGDYQRVFTPRNENRCRALIANWNWALYTPIIVAPLAGGKFAVIDGQHRAASAKACGIVGLPAWIIEADAAGQARAFLAVNASPTRVDSLQLWHSRFVGGDRSAAALWDICTQAGVEIARYPIAADDREPHVTLCPGVLHELLQGIGKALLLRTLKIVVAVGKARKLSLITRNVMRSVSRLVGTVWAELDNDTIAAGLERVNFAKAIAAANADAKDRGLPVIDCLCEAINAGLTAALENLEVAAE